jgi:hypothetical protein
MDITLICACVFYVLGGVGWWAFMAEAEGRESWGVFAWSVVWPLVAMAGLVHTGVQSLRRALARRA